MTLILQSAAAEWNHRDSLGGFGSIDDYLATSRCFDRSNQA